MPVGSFPRRRRRALVVAASLCLLAAPAGLRGSEATSRAAELERIRFEIERLERRLTTVTARRGDQGERLERLRLEVALQEERVAEARTERRLVEERLAELGDRKARERHRNQWTGCRR